MVSGKEAFAYDGDNELNERSAAYYNGYDRGCEAVQIRYLFPGFLPRFPPASFTEAEREDFYYGMRHGTIEEAWRIADRYNEVGEEIRRYLDELE